MTPKPPTRTLKDMLAEGASVETEAKGLRCPKCHCPDMRVAWTRKGSGGIRRVRVCANCGMRVPTFESI